MFLTTERVLRFRDSNWTKNSFVRNQKLKRTTNRKRKIYNIQLNIAIQIDCIVILSRIVQFRKQTRIRKTTWKNLENKISRTNYLDAIKILYQIFYHSISCCFHRYASIVSSFRLFITIITNQKRQNNWKICAICQSIHAKRIFYIQIIEKQRENNNFDRFVLFAKYQKSKYEQHRQ